jgi:hypothetical protein
VEVTNENDNTPLTLLPVYYPSVPENSPLGREVITLLAEDADEEDNPSPLTFRITAGNPESFFSIENGKYLYQKNSWIGVGIVYVHHDMETERLFRFLPF